MRFDLPNGRTLYTLSGEQIREIRLREQPRSYLEGREVIRNAGRWPETKVIASACIGASTWFLRLSCGHYVMRSRRVYLDSVVVCDRCAEASK